MKIKKMPFFAESWNVAFRKRTANILYEDLDAEFTIINNSWRYWAADPFVFEYGDSVFVFAELYDYLRCRGIIGYCQIKDNQIGRWTPVIIESYHLSFPFIWEKDGEIYLMPEASESGKLCLYKAIEFPRRWEKISDIRENVKLVDTIPVDDNKRYLLSYDVDNHSHHKVVLIDTVNIENDYVVCEDVANVKRSAGGLLDNNIRVAQNCTEAYGKGLIFYRYSFIKDQYKEEEICRINPDDLVYNRSIYLDGIHTYNQSKKFEVIDIKTRRFNLLNFFCRLINKTGIRIIK